LVELVLFFFTKARQKPERGTFCTGWVGYHTKDVNFHPPKMSDRWDEMRIHLDSHPDVMADPRGLTQGCDCPYENYDNDERQFWEINAQQQNIDIDGTTAVYKEGTLQSVASIFYNGDLN